MVVVAANITATVTVILFVALTIFLLFYFPFRDIKLEDSGKYILELYCPERRINSFDVIVQERPSIRTDCTSMSIYEGESLTCTCKTTNNSYFGSVRWNRTKPKQDNINESFTLENISKNQSGTYTCIAESQNFDNKASFKLDVLSKSSKARQKVKIEFFSAFKVIGVNSRKVILICKANGFPRPTYMISHNQTRKKESEEMHIFDRRDISVLGKYECLAKNGDSNDSRSLHIDSSFLEGNKEEADKDERLEMLLILGACSFIAGTVFVGILVCCCKKLCKKHDDDKNSDYDDVVPRWPNSKHEYDQGPGSENDERRLRHTTGRPGNEVSRDSVVYDLPLKDQRQGDQVYYNESSQERVYYNERKNDKVYYNQSNHNKVYRNERRFQELT